MNNECLPFAVDMYRVLHEGHISAREQLLDWERGTPSNLSDGIDPSGRSCAGNIFSKGLTSRSLLKAPPGFQIWKMKIVGFDNFGGMFSITAFN